MPLSVGNMYGCYFSCYESRLRFASLLWFCSLSVSLCLSVAVGSSHITPCGDGCSDVEARGERIVFVGAVVAWQAVLWQGLLWLVGSGCSRGWSR
jgi:hypothetical protein